jgi:hypothetical protein
MQALRAESLPHQCRTDSLSAVGQHRAVAVLKADGVRVGCGIERGHFRSELAEVREQTLEGGADRCCSGGC